jgi:DHA1 family multidrug resistance protein-like MFS transporter
METPVDAPWKRTLAIMFLAQMITSVGFSSIFPFLPLYVKSLGTVSGVDTEIMAGLVFSGQALAMALASPFWGALADRRGRKMMVERAMFGGALILGLMALVRSSEELLLLRIVQGFVTGTIGAANALVAATVPRTHTGFAMGLMQVALGIGVALGPILGGTVADAVGYRAAFYVTAALLAVSGVVVLVGVREDFVPPRAPEGRRPGFWSEWGRILAAPGVRMTYGLRFMNQMGRMIFVPILPLFALELLAGPERVNSFTGLVVGASAAAAAVFAVYLGRLGDRIGHRPIVVASFAGAGVFFLLQSLVTAGWQLLALQAAVGVFLGGIVPGISVLLARYTRCGDEGAVYGLDNSITSGARALAPMLGVAIAMGLGFRAVFVAAAALYLAGSLLAARGLPRAGEGQASAGVCRPERPGKGGGGG